MVVCVDVNDWWWVWMLIIGGVYGWWCVLMLMTYGVCLCVCVCVQMRTQESLKVPQLDIAVPMHLRGKNKKAGKAGFGEPSGLKRRLSILKKDDASMLTLH